MGGGAAQGLDHQGAVVDVDQVVGAVFEKRLHALAVQVEVTAGDALVADTADRFAVGQVGVGAAEDGQVMVAAQTLGDAGDVGLDRTAADGGHGQFFRDDHQDVHLSFLLSRLGDQGVHELLNARVLGQRLLGRLDQ